MKKHLIAGLFSILIILGSCKKEDTKNTDPAAIEGTYTFKYLTAKTNSTISSSDGEKAVTLSDYTSIDNQGTLVFDKSTLSYTALSYKIDTDATFYIYQDNALLDSSSFPFNASLPPTSASTAFTLVGADSIYFPQGSVNMGGVSNQTIASGGRYTISGKLLTITQHVSKDSTFEDSGVMYNLNESASTSTVMEKQ